MTTITIIIGSISCAVFWKFCLKDEIGRCHSLMDFFVEYEEEE